MRPFKFTVKEGVTTFHYRFSELRKFLEMGFTEGNVGWILTQRSGETRTYRGFGTIESPRTILTTIEFTSIALFGESISDEDVIKPITAPKREWSFYLIDQENGTTEETILK